MSRTPFARTVIASLMLSLGLPMLASPAIAAAPFASSAENTVVSWNSVVDPDGATTLAIRFEQPFTGNMATLTGPQGDYVAFDFPAARVADVARLTGVAQGAVKGLRFVETGKRLRAIVQIEKGISYKAFVQSGVLIVRFASAVNAPVEARVAELPAAPAKIALPAVDMAPQVSMPTAGLIASGPSPVLGSLATSTPVVSTTKTITDMASLKTTSGGVSPEVIAAAKTVGAAATLRDIEYKRTNQTTGQLVLDLSDPGVKVKVYRDGMNLVVDLPNTALPRNLAKRMRVDNMETAVIAISPSVPREGYTKLTLETRGGWDYQYAQNGTLLTIDMFKIGDDYKVGGKRLFTGKKLSLSFQDIEVRVLLQILAEFTGMNIIASESVNGKITLRLNEVPWDQALDIVMTSRGLDMRRNGQVLWIAPKEEIAKKDQQELLDRQAMEGLEPLVSEDFQLHYQKAEEMKKILQPSKGGYINFDARTNRLFIKDTAERLEEMRRIVRQVDIPVQQVNIEAKIVEVTDSFAKNVGVKFGMDGVNFGVGSNRLGIGSTVGGNVNAINGSNTSSTSTTSGPTLNVNLPAAGINGASPGSFAFTLFNSSLTKFLNLEVNALEADGKAKTISSPRVVTEDGVEATIEDGTELPYQQATSSGATSVSFRKATMSLKVTPKITPEGRVTLGLEVHKDAVGQQTTSGPAIDTKAVKTSVQVENGGTIVIGGIFVVEENTTENKVPLLGDIPVVGNAFKNNAKTTRKREMVIMITPRIVNK